jgi:hypothetical protein
LFDLSSSELKLTEVLPASVLEIENRRKIKMGIESFGIHHTPEKKLNTRRERFSNATPSPPPVSEYCDRILSRQQLVRLKEHRYSCLCSSLLDKYLQPYWNWLVLQIPIWMAPNLITILGLIINVVTSLILIVYSPDCKQPVSE